MTKQTAWRVFLTVLIAGIFAVQYQQVSLLERIAVTMADVANDTLNTSWKSGGNVVKVTTKRNIGESDAALLVRHTAEVSAKLETHPID